MTPLADEIRLYFGESRRLREFPENEVPARFQHPANLPNRACEAAAVLGDVFENTRRHDGIERAILERQRNRFLGLYPAARELPLECSYRSRRRAHNVRRRAKPEAFEQRRDVAV